MCTENFNVHRVRWVVPDNYKEVGMSKTLEIKEENVKKAYDEACPEAKKVLADLFPDITRQSELNIDNKGELWGLPNWGLHIITCTSGKMRFHSILDGNVWSSEDSVIPYGSKKIANSLKEYLDNGGKL